MKKYFKALIVKLLWLQVDRLRRRHNPIVIAVAGSIGKTGTKSAIATVLSQTKKVRWQDGNYNDIVSVPLIFFGQDMPSLFNPIGWIRVFIYSERQIRGNYSPEIVVLEVGTDYDGNMDEFMARLHADYGVLSAISAEHMANFESMDAVANEELKLESMVDEILVNADQVDAKYLKKIHTPITYGEGTYDCSINPSKLTKDLYRPVSFSLKTNKLSISFRTRLIGRQNLPGLAVAAILGDKLGLSANEIKAGLEKVKPIPGRMQLLLGKKQSLLIDDTYNASPEAVIAALNTLYEIPSTSRIAVLGQMNELGKFSESMHKKVGAKCDPAKLELLVTIGDDANNYLAESAEKEGCKVVRCPSPYHAADIVNSLLKKGTVVLLKGSQNGVFAEETTKQLLQRPSDHSKIVRQSDKWLKLKESQFAK